MGDVIETERSVEAKVLEDPFKISLGGVEYAIKPLKMGASRKWRERYLLPLSKKLADMFAVAGKIRSKTESVELGTVADMAAWLVTELPGDVFDAVCAYCPEIAADRERVEENAFDVELIEAFTGVLKVALPLDRMLAALGVKPVKTVEQSTEPAGK